MHITWKLSALASTLVGLSRAAPAPQLSPHDGSSTDTSIHVLTSSKVDGSISLVANSGVCETTPGVTTYSGYINEANDTQHFFYWFFEARHNPETAPFSIWFNGGPGCSSMIGLFQEHGPCSVNADNTTKLNPYSWNNYSNMIYIDQPIGTGFSYGDDTVNSTQTAAPPVWKLFQILFENGHFEKYTSRKLGLWTESYGGHYGPEFVTYFEEQNAKIDAGELSGEKITFDVLGINNGWYDPIIQNLAYMEYAKYNGIKVLVNESIYQEGLQNYWMPGGCYDQEVACYKTGNDTICSDADNFCSDTQFNAAIGDQSSYYILDPADTDFPSENYLGFLSQPDIMTKIGAMSTYGECADAPYEPFAATGDDARTLLPALQEILNAGKVRTLIWNGVVDFNCNWFGNEKCLEDAGWKGHSTFKSQSYRDVHYAGNGTVYGQAKTVDAMTWLKVYGAGHEIPAYRPAAAYETFVNFWKGKYLD